MDRFHHLKDVGPRNPITGRVQKKRRNTVSFRRRSSYCYSVNEKNMALYCHWQALINSEMFNSIMRTVLQNGLLLWMMQIHGSPLVQQIFVTQNIIMLMTLWGFKEAEKINLLRVDSVLMDIDNVIFGTPVYTTPKHYLLIAQFVNDDHAVNNTNFTKEQLYFLMIRLGLDEEWIRYEYGPGKWHMYHREDVFIWMLMRFKLGKQKNRMSEDHGCENTRYLRGYNYLIHCLYKQWGWKVSVTNLRNYVGEFAGWAECLGKYIASPRIRRDPTTGEISFKRSVWFPPGDYSVSLLLDCTNVHSAVLGSGHVENREGGSRKPNADLEQQALWSGHHHDWELRILTLLSPNGRGGDLIAVNDSQLDDFLADMQITRGIAANKLFSCYGDMIFCGLYRCIRCGHRALPGLLLTLLQENTNSAMKSA